VQAILNNAPGVGTSGQHGGVREHKLTVVTHISLHWQAAPTTLNTWSMKCWKLSAWGVLARSTSSWSVCGSGGPDVCGDGSRHHLCLAHASFSSSEPGQKSMSLQHKTLFCCRRSSDTDLLVALELCNPVHMPCICTQYEVSSYVRMPAGPVYTLYVGCTAIAPAPHLGSVCRGDASCQGKGSHCRQCPCNSNAMITLVSIALKVVAMYDHVISIGHLSGADTSYSGCPQVIASHLNTNVCPCRRKGM
jgi:hypothetical protein